jgi:hypothetical protein
VLEDEVFVGHGTMFINDKFPAATTADGVLKTDEDWELSRTVVERRASLGFRGRRACRRADRCRGARRRGSGRDA